MAARLHTLLRTRITHARTLRTRRLAHSGYASAVPAVRCRRLRTGRTRATPLNRAAVTTHGARGGGVIDDDEEEDDEDDDVEYEYVEVEVEDEDEDADADVLVEATASAQASQQRQQGTSASASASATPQQSVVSVLNVENSEQNLKSVYTKNEIDPSFVSPWDTSPGLASPTPNEKRADALSTGIMPKSANAVQRWWKNWRESVDPHSGSSNVGTIQPWEVPGAKPEHWPMVNDRTWQRRGDYNWYMQFYPAKRYTYTTHGLPRVRERLRYNELLRDIRHGKVEYLVQWEKPVKVEMVVVYTKKEGRVVKCALIPTNDVRIRLAANHNGVPIFVQKMSIDHVMPGGGYTPPSTVANAKAFVTSAEGKKFLTDARGIVPPIVIVLIYAFVRVAKWSRGDLGDRDAMYKEQIGGRAFNKRVEDVIVRIKDVKLKEQLRLMQEQDGVTKDVAFREFRTLRKTDQEGAESLGFGTKEAAIEYVRNIVIQWTREENLSREVAAAALEQWSVKTFEAGKQFRRTVGDEGRGVDGKNLNLVYNKREDRVSLDDVAGIGAIRQELQEIVDFFKNARKFGDSGATVPRGVLFVGPPGTGKTLIARAMAGEIDCNFYAINASEFCEIFAGVGAARVRRLFADAVRNAPAVIFIDEIDAVGRTRAVTDPNEERNQTLNQLLTELDGFNPRKTDVIIMAATNRVDILDSALIRPGRFDRIVNVPKPNKEGRGELFRLYCSKFNMLDDVEEVVKFGMSTRFEGASGATVAGLFNVAARYAARKGETGISIESLRKCVYTVSLESARPPPMDMAERGAFTQAGKILAVALLPGQPRIEAAGCGCGKFGDKAYTTVQQDRCAIKRDEIDFGVDVVTKGERNLHLVLQLSGRAGEESRFGPLGLSTNHSYDMWMAKQIAQGMMYEDAMSEDDRLGWNFRALSLPLIRLREGSMVNPQDISNTIVDAPHSLYEDVEEIIKQKLDASYEAALQIISENREAYEQVARALLENRGRAVDGEVLHEIVDKYKKRDYKNQRGAEIQQGIQGTFPWQKPQELLGSGAE
ncbi:vesicle-fusing ATPase [Pycnococcus provasolii]